MFSSTPALRHLFQLDHAKFILDLISKPHRLSFIKRRVVNEQGLRIATWARTLQQDAVNVFIHSHDIPSTGAVIAVLAHN
jgi:hypothetical protein